MPPDNDDTIVPFPGNTLPGETTTLSENKRRNGRRKPDRRTKAERLEVGRQALEMHMAGMPFDAVARQLDYASGSGAYKAAMAALREGLLPISSEARELEVRRLDRLLNAWWVQALGDVRRGVPPGDVATDKVLKILSLRYRLLGIDAAKVELTGPAGEAIPVQVTADVREFIALLATVAPELPGAGASPSAGGASPNGSVLPASTNGQAKRLPPELQA